MTTDDVAPGREAGSGETEAPGAAGASQPSLSATVITKDAERTLHACLGALGWVDEIVILDSGSTDATEEIARRHGARFHRRDWPGYGIQKQRAVGAARGAWILSVDADELVSEPLARSIRSAVADPGGRSGFEVACHTRFMDAWLGGRGWWTDWKLRLFRKEKGRFTPDPVHEGVRVQGRTGRLRGPLYHDPWRDVEHRLSKDNRYGTLAAVRDYRNGRRAGRLTPLVRAGAWFLKEYLVRGSFVHGQAGAIHAGLVGAYAFQRSVKLREIEHRTRTGSSTDRRTEATDASGGEGRSRLRGGGPLRTEGPEVD